jgi:hypothetical protein
VLIPFSNPARAAHMLAFDTRGGFAFLLLSRLIQRPDHQPPAPAPGLAGRLLQPGHREPPDLGHRRVLVPHRPVQQPLRPVRCPVTDMLGNGPAVALRQLACHRPHVLTGLHERLDPPKTRAQPLGQLTQLPPSQPSTYPGSRSRLRSCSSHKHMINRRLPHVATGPQPRPFPQVTTQMAAAVLEGKQRHVASLLCAPRSSHQPR